MRYLLLFMLLVAVFVVGKRSCHFDGFGVRGTGPAKTESRNVTGFHAVSLDLSGDVEVRVGDFKVEVQAQENLLPLLKTEVENGTLRLYFDESISHSQDIKILITAPSFDAFSLGGSGEIKVLSPIQSDKMDISLGGSGNIVMSQATYNTLECSIAGSGGIELAGKANNARIDVSGSGEVNARNMEMNELRAQISGSGSISANVVQLLKADVSGSGEIHYSGSPTVETNVSGSGSVSKM
jgi:Putative auto-transporter adhesin, head GIN domain